MTNIEKFTESYTKFYDSYFDYLEEMFKENYGHVELEKEDSMWVVEKLKDDPYRDVLFQCMNDIVLEIVTNLGSKYSN